MKNIYGSVLIIVIVALVFIIIQLFQNIGDKYLQSNENEIRLVLKSVENHIINNRRELNINKYKIARIAKNLLNSSWSILIVNLEDQESLMIDVDGVEFENVRILYGP